MDDDDDDDAPSTSGRVVDDAAILRGFDLDPALSAWITARFLFIWTVSGYLSVPTLALLEGVDDVSALRTSHLALALVVAELGKLGATSLMLRSELAGAPSASSAASDPWSRWRRYPNRASVAADALRGVAFGIAASVAARLADAAINGVNAEADGGAGGGALALLDTAGGTAGDYSLAVFTLVLSSCAIAPVLEELFFRGFALPACERLVGNVWVSVTCTAGLFAAVHFSVEDAPSLFVAGCFFGASAVDANRRDANRRDGVGGDGRVVGLAAPTAAHATFNAGVLLEAMLRSRG